MIKHSNNINGTARSFLAGTPTRLAGTGRFLPVFTNQAEDFYSLLLRARSGDEEALTEIILSCRYRIHFYVKHYLRQGLSMEDLEQEGFMGVWRAIKDYDPSRSSFRTYSNWWIHGTIRSAVRIKKRQIPYEIMVPLEDWHSPIKNKSSNYKTEKLTTSLKCLDSRSKEIVKSRYGIECEQMELKEMAQKFRLSQQRIRRILSNALKKIHRHINSLQNII